MPGWSTTLLLAALAVAERVPRADLAAALGGAFLPGEDMVSVPGGVYTPVFPVTPAESRVSVVAFSIDRLPVTNLQFRAFTRATPVFQRGRVPSIASDAGYLSHWASADRLGPGVGLLAPVVRVSWFAAKAYCEARGARLPTEAEWEYVASASEDRPDGRRDPAWAARILEWYGRPAGEVTRDVGGQPPNFFGVEDLHGLVWEWVLDFNSTLVGDARESGDGDRMKFCGATALAAVDKGDYATFMRVAMRSSLSATYTTGSLGFRCARDAKP